MLGAGGRMARDSNEEPADKGNVGADIECDIDLTDDEACG
mgnify:CR=1 FL=1